MIVILHQWIIIRCNYNDLDKIQETLPQICQVWLPREIITQST